jgi:Flp pilus assembly protein TadD
MSRFPRPKPATATAVISLALVALPALAAPRSAPPQPAGQNTSSAAGGVAATKAAPQSFDGLAARAARAKTDGRLDEAAALYRKALAQRPAWLEGRWALGTLDYDRDRYAEAAQQFEKIVAARPGDARALALLGLSRARTGQLQPALDPLMKARAIGIPEASIRSVVNYQTAVLLNRLGDPDSAFEVLKPFALESDDRPPVIEAFGLITLRLPLLPGQVPEDKREMVLLAGRGGYHMARVDRDQVGRLALEELVSRFPATANVHFALAMYLLVEDPDASIDEFRKELVVSPSHHVAMIQLALAELRRGRAEAALPVAADAVRLAPTVPAARLAYGRALLGVGKTDDAVRELEEAVRLAPENARLHFSLASAYMQAGRPAEAARERSEFQRLQKSSRPTPETDSAADEGSPSSRDR